MAPSRDPAPRETTAIEPRRVVTLVLVLLLVLVLGVWRHHAMVDDTIHDFSGATMGTSWSARIDADLSGRERTEARQTVQARLDHVSGLMSTFDPESELSRFNRHTGTDAVRVSPELLRVLALARDVSERSGGAFDVTVAPYVDAWGFGPSESRNPPDDAELAELSPHVGYQLLAIDPAAGTVSKTDPATKIDLSAIAKGYAADEVTDALRQIGLTSFLVEVGGEIRTVGSRRDGRAWRVGIERPDEQAPGYWGTVDLTDQGIATSGDYRNYHEVDGVAYAHIIDPRTGRPIRMRRMSVSVVHPSTAMADAWATALTVLGPEDGYALARVQGLSAIFIVEAEGGLQSLMTPALSDRFAVEPSGR